MVPINNKPQIIPCLVSSSWQAGGSFVTDLINSKTTLYEFYTILEVAGRDYKLTNGGREGWNVLGMAVKVENIPLIQEIIAIGTKELFNYANENGHTPLHIAAENDNPEKARELINEIIRLGSEVNLSLPGKNYTPLVHSLKRNNIENFRLLLSHNAIIPDNLDEDSKGLLRFAVSNVKNSRKI